MSFVSALSALTGLAAEPASYLPVVGPPPLRFALPPAPPPSDRVILPPMTTVVPMEASRDVRPSESPPPLPPVAGSTTPPAEPPPVPPDGSLPPSLFALPVPVPELPPSPLLYGAVPPMDGAPNVQMLLKYFVPQLGTNSNVISILTPVPFIPPQPLVPSSSASFETTAPGKP